MTVARTTTNSLLDIGRQLSLSTPISLFQSSGSVTPSQLTPPSLSTKDTSFTPSLSPLPAKTLFTSPSPSPTSLQPLPSSSPTTPQYSQARMLRVNQKLQSFYGEYPTRTKLALTKFGRPSRNHTFTSEATFDHALVILLKSSILSDPDIRTLLSTHPLYEHLYHTIHRFRNVDFRSLSTINKKYATQTVIPLQRRQLFLAAACHYDFHVPTLIQFLGKNYTNSHLNPHLIAQKLRGIAPPEVISYVHRALLTGAPNRMHGHSSAKKFHQYRLYGNHASITSRPDLVQKALNKEERNNFIIPLPSWLSRFVPNLHLSPEGIIIKEGKKDRIIFDASFKIFPTSACPNTWTSKFDEPPIWYGSAFSRHLIRIWNLRISYPNLEIYLWDDDVAGAFRLVKYNPYIASAFSAVVNSILCVPTGQVFGGNTSAQNFEGLAIAREHLSQHFSNDSHKHLIVKHSNILDNITYSPLPPPNTVFVQATPDPTHKGVFLPGTSTPCNTPHHMFVDDNHIADIYPRIRLAQAASIEGLFQLLGFPEKDLRRSVLSEDKYFEQACGPIKLQLGYRVNTRTMSVGFSPVRISALADLLLQWSSRRKSYTIKEAAKLAGLLEFIASVSTWVRFLTVSLKHAILMALRCNTSFVQRNPKYSTMIADTHLLSTDIDTIRKKDFAISKIMQQIWNTKKRFHITNALKKELKLLYYLFSNPDTFPFTSPIAHIIDRASDFQAKGDACLDGAGGYSTDLSFWWFVEWPDYVKRKTIKYFIKYYHGVQSTRLSINLLEYVAIIISFAAAITKLHQGIDLPQPYPSILIFSDNTTAISWTKKAASSTKEGKALAHLLTSLMIHHPSVGLSSKFISGSENTIADSISRMSTPTHLSTFSLLSQTYPSLQGLPRFLPSPELLSRIWDALSSKQVHPLDPILSLGHFNHDTKSG